MLVTLIINLIAVGVAWLSGRGMRHALLLSCSLIFLFLALRYDFGNDYLGYYYHFTEVASQPLSQLISDSAFEPGYVFSCWLFAQLGLNFFCFVATIAFFECYVLYTIIKEHVPAQYHWMAVAIYLFNPGLMLIQCSAIRQTIAIFLFLYSIKFIIKQKLIPFILCIFAGSLFHSSCLILLPLYWMLKPYKINSVSKIMVACIYLFVLFCGTYIIQELTPVINLINPRYIETFSTSGQVGTGLLIIFYFMCLVLLLYYVNSTDGTLNAYIKIAMLYFIISVLGVALMMIGRVCFYFAMALVVVIPCIVHKISDFRVKAIVGGTFLLLYCYLFYIHFQDELCKEKYGVYKIIPFE